MPLIKKDKCTGCGSCVEECPAKTIVIEDEKAQINMDKCFLCGVCFDICQENAVLDDGEKVPIDVKSNIEKTKACLDLCSKHFDYPEAVIKCLDRWIKDYYRKKAIAEKTIDELKTLRKTL
ncbi:MAG: 4Fe-4S binding protein [Desulfobacterales bacterium]|nr:4Fe-4S binding protein [Desulfobacterales bacterium]